MALEFVPEDYFLVALPGESVRDRVCTSKTFGWGRKLSKAGRVLDRENLELERP